MTSVADSLTAKLGPLPVWAWGVGAGAAFNIGRYLVNRRKSASVPAEEPAPGDADAGPESSVSVGGSGSGYYSPGIPSAQVNPGAWGTDEPSTTPATDSAPSTPAAPADNDEWRARAVELLTASGMAPLTVDEAVKRYFAGSPLSPQDQAIISTAVRRLGVPPGGAPPITAAPAPSVTAPAPAGPTAPAPAPAPAPVANPVAAGTSVTVKSGDTLYGLVRAKYGSASLTKLREVAAFNGITLGPAPNYVPRPFAVGQTIRFP